MNEDQQEERQDREHGNRKPEEAPLPGQAESDDAQPDDAQPDRKTSTPDGEVDDAERAEFLAAMEQGFEVERADRGEIVTGTIVSLGKEFAFIDLGGKSEGILSLEEIRGEDGSLPAAGDSVEACVLSSGPDGLVLSKKLAKGIRSREFMAEAARNRIPIEGRVEGRNKGGFDVVVAGMRGFCPIGQIELRFCEDPDVHLGKKYSFLITKFDDSGRRPDLVVSRKILLQTEAEKRAQELRKTLREGDIVPGTVSKIMDFGAFVDLGGLEGLLHVSELSHSHVDDPRNLLREGEEIHVQVISIEQGGDRIGLSLKRLEGDPWDDVMLSFPPGSKVRGKVVRLEPFGAFVELKPGIDGLIHVSNFNTPERVSHPRHVVQIGQDIDVEVMTVSPEQRRIGLARIPAEGEFGDIPVVGAVMEGKVDKVANFGVFVTLGPGRKGLVPNVEMGTSRGADHRKSHPPGTPIKVKVLEVTDNGKKIRLSHRAAKEEEERKEFEGYVQKDAGPTRGGFGTLGDLLKDKIKSS